MPLIEFPCIQFFLVRLFLSIRDCLFGLLHYVFTNMVQTRLICYGECHGLNTSQALYEVYVTNHNRNTNE